MKLQQLRYLVAINRNQLNISAAAEALYTSQPGISKQIRQLEDELGVELFERSGKHLVSLTPIGQQIIEKAEAVLQEVQNIKVLAEEYSDDKRGTLSIATTDTQARYKLPAVVEKFHQRYPDVALQIHQGSPDQIVQLVSDGIADFAIATEAPELFEEFIMLPCYYWHRCLIVRPDHPLAQLEKVTIKTLSEYPLVTHVFGFTGNSRLDEAFRSARLQPNVAFTATDTDMIKTYVRLGLGVGIIARMAYNAESDHDLHQLDASYLFTPSMTKLGFRRGTQLRGYMYDFINFFAPHLTPDTVRQAERLVAQNIDLMTFFEDWELSVD